MKAPSEIVQLVEHYKSKQADLESGHYDEDNTRREFIEPLMRALGWDVANLQQAGETYKEVVSQYKLRLGDTYRAPDYGFRVGRDIRFFLEAKRPGVDITKDKAPAYQLRRYGWTAKLPISVLANFRHVAVYDCTKKPSVADAPAVARTELFKWEELVERWDELTALLSRKGVWQGSLDKYEQARKRGTATVDEAFLDEMEAWRRSLAYSLAKKNANLDAYAINEVVQQTIDRLVFLRIAEDRGIETPDTLKNQTSRPGIYKRLTDVFRQADQRYNSGLFHFRREKHISGEPDRLSLSVEIEDGALRQIIHSMYYPSPYAFSVFPADILGQVYEQFLGKVIVLDSKRHASVVEKPEVKKAGGVYYTPAHVAEHIVRSALEAQLKGKTPGQALKLRVLDPACGSGSFLITAYEHLLQWFADQYRHASLPTRKKKMFQDQTGTWQLKLGARREILTSCIYGVDIDQQAVEVTKLSLMLKVLEGQVLETIGAQLQIVHVERVLPDLNDNIQSGNSLISEVSSLSLDNEEELALNPFDWQQGFPGVMRTGGFDVVVGNPPYDVLEKDRGQASWPHDKLHEYLDASNEYREAAGGKLNLFRLFVVRAISLTKRGGSFE